MIKLVFLMMFFFATSCSTSSGNDDDPSTSDTDTASDAETDTDRDTDTDSDTNANTDSDTDTGLVDMRNITSLDLVKEMVPGWNLGNTLDAIPDETSWGNPPTTQSMIDLIRAAGFNTVRIPVTWADHMGPGPEYEIDEERLNRVEETANYVLSTGMYAIVNSHHDEWVSLMPDVDHAAIEDKLVKLWIQIATRFRDYNDYLILETLNEPRTTDNTEWNGGTPEARDVLNAYNAAAVNAIRGTGGNNALRHLMIPTHAANSGSTPVNALVVPNNDERIIVSIHTYSPLDFCFEGDWVSWGADSDRASMVSEIEAIADLLPRKGIAAVVGEWGSVNKNNLEARVDHAGTYAQEATARGLCPIWWDNGDLATGFALIDRNATPPVWSLQEIVDAIVFGAQQGAANPIP